MRNVRYVGCQHYYTMIRKEDRYFSHVQEEGTDLAEAAQDKVDAELMDSWSKFRKKMAPIRKAYREELDKTKSNNEIVTSLQRMTETIVNGNTSRPSKLVKQTKVPSWCKGMKYEAYKKSIIVWVENN